MVHRASVLTVLAVALAAAPGDSQAPTFDILITGGTVVDGSGAPGRRADVGIRNGRITAIARVLHGRAADTIDASGLVVAPGFVDVHTHGDDIATSPRAENFVRMGVTSIVAGNCGASALDVGEALANIRNARVSINYATLIGHNTVRQAAMGTANRHATVAELAQMKSAVWRAMADGAVGFSTGLQYVPGTYAPAPEILELARVAANAGGMYASHMRNEGTALEAALEETLRVGDLTGCRLQISHLKVDSPGHWGASARALALIDAARARGVEVAADQYAYTAASSTLGIRFPSWSLEGGEAAIARRLNDPATWAKIKAEMRAVLAERGLPDLSFAVVALYRADPTLNGLTMREVAAKMKSSGSADAQLEAAREMMLRGGASMVYHLMSDRDVDRIMQHPSVAVASDSAVLTPGEGTPHPRGYGNSVRVLGEYVRTRRVVTLEEAVRKMTSLPAHHFRFSDRGLLKEGYAADVTIFDPARVADVATFEKPHGFAAGVPHVLVNGIAVVRNGAHTGAAAGQVLTLPAGSK